MSLLCIFFYYVWFLSIWSVLILIELYFLFEFIYFFFTSNILFIYSSVFLSTKACHDFLWLMVFNISSLNISFQTSVPTNYHFIPLTFSSSFNKSFQIRPFYSSLNNLWMKYPWGICQRSLVSWFTSLLEEAGKLDDPMVGMSNIKLRN